MSASVHGGCGGEIVADADFVSGAGDEYWWNFRCSKCKETFQTLKEALEDTNEGE